MFRRQRTESGYSSGCMNGSFEGRDDYLRRRRCDEAMETSSLLSAAALRHAEGSGVRGLRQDIEAACRSLPTSARADWSLFSSPQPSRGGGDRNCTLLQFSRLFRRQRKDIAT